MITRESILCQTRLTGGILVGLLVLGTAIAQAADCVRPKGLKGTTPHVINFDVSSTEIPPDQQAWLKEQAERFQSHPSLEVCVIGQADKTGDAELNKKLSMERAETVVAVLKDNGLADKKFQVIGRGEAFGDTKDSLAGSLLEGESAADRRVEVILFK
jgi:outer membrane protein OmpA-like peptidoglycan-associated protein